MSTSRIIISQSKREICIACAHIVRVDFIESPLSIEIHLVNGEKVTETFESRIDAVSKYNSIISKVWPTA